MFVLYICTAHICRDVSEQEFDTGVQLAEQDDDVQLDEDDTPLFSFQLAPDNDANDSDNNDDKDDVDVEHKYKLEIVQEDIDFVEGLVVNTRLCTRAPDEVLSAADAACTGEVMTKSVSVHSVSIHVCCSFDCMVRSIVTLMSAVAFRSCMQRSVAGYVVLQLVQVYIALDILLRVMCTLLVYECGIAAYSMIMLQSCSTAK
jgi:hypothetical protein